MASNEWSIHASCLNQQFVLMEVAQNNEPLLDYLGKLTTLTMKEEFRLSIPGEVLDILVKIMQIPVNNKVMIECVRIIRNCCGENWLHFPEKWNLLFEKTIELLEHCLAKDLKDEEIVVLARVTLQCLGNVLNTQPHVAARLWNSLQSFLGDLILHIDEKISLYSSAVMFGLLRNSPSVMDEITLKKWEKLSSALITSSHQGILYSQFAVQLYINNQSLLEKMFAVHELDTRLLLLHQISEFLPNIEADPRIWKYFSKLFQERASIILRTCESSTIDLEAVEVSGLVEILAKNSSNDVCRHELYLDKELLVTTIDLLRSVHSLGKSGSNYFSTVEDHFGSVEPHPALNFKCNLVRLLGNLCYQNPAAQDQARELEVIAPLLECSNLDARNPFIQQWSILAIRNFCEKNPQNQELINSMTRRGDVQPAVLEELGLDVRDSGSGLTISQSNKQRP